MPGSPAPPSGPEEASPQVSTGESFTLISPNQENPLVHQASMTALNRRRSANAEDGVESPLFGDPQHADEEQPRVSAKHEEGREVSRVTREESSDDVSVKPPAGPPPPLGSDGAPLDGPYDYPVAFPLPSHVLSRDCPAPPCFQRRVGRLYVCLETRKGKPLIVVGPCWPMLLVTMLLIAGGSALVLYFFGRISIPIIIIGAVLSAFVVFALAMTGCSNPGIVERYQTRRKQHELFDERAQSFRPDGCKYDQETSVLAYEIDHFCPWTGTLIARNNLCAFKVFTSSLCILILFSIAVAMYGAIEGNRRGGMGL